MASALYTSGLGDGKWTRFMHTKDSVHALQVTGVQSMPIFYTGPFLL